MELELGLWTSIRRKQDLISSIINKGSHLALTKHIYEQAKCRLKR
jgi:hypothetical protein